MENPPEDRSRPYPVVSGRSSIPDQDQSPGKPASALFLLLLSRLPGLRYHTCRTFRPLGYHEMSVATGNLFLFHPDTLAAGCCHLSTAPPAAESLLHSAGRNIGRQNTA